MGKAEDCDTSRMRHGGGADRQNQALASFLLARCANMISQGSVWPGTTPCELSALQLGPRFLKSLLILSISAPSQPGDYFYKTSIDGQPVSDSKIEARPERVTFSPPLRSY